MPMDQSGFDRIYRGSLVEGPRNFKMSQRAKGLMSYGISGAIGGTIGSTVGSYAGATLSAQTGGDPYEGMAIGGTIGGIAGAGVAVAGTALARNIKPIAGKAADTMLDVGINAATAIKSALAPEALKETGLKALGGAKTIGKLGFNTASVGIGVAGRAVNTAGFVGSLLTSEYKEGFLTRKLSGAATNEKINNLVGRRFNLAGKVAVGAFAIGSGVVEGFKAHEKYRMGSNDGQVRRATPTIGSSNMDYAGATGDIVFALNANKKRW